MKDLLVQIAGVHSIEEALMLVGLGVNDIGIPLRLPVHKEDVSEEEAKRIFTALGRDVGKVLITYEERLSELQELLTLLAPNKVQFHSDIDPHTIASVKRSFPSLFIIKSIVIGPADDTTTVLARAQVYEGVVDAFITDTFDPTTGASGATGKTHDLSLSKALIDHSSTPVILAGGLKPENVAEAVRYCQPYGVDAHTGVEGPDGFKDRAKVEAFVVNARSC